MPYNQSAHKWSIMALIVLSSSTLPQQMHKFRPPFDNHHVYPKRVYIYIQTSIAQDNEGVTSAWVLSPHCLALCWHPAWELLTGKCILKHFSYHHLLITKNPSLLYGSWMKNHYMCQLLSDAWWSSAVGHGKDETTLWNTEEGKRQKNLSTLKQALSKRWNTGFVVLK